jgi:hypothetical protein
MYHIALAKTTLFTHNHAELKNRDISMTAQLNSAGVIPYTRGGYRMSEIAGEQRVFAFLNAYARYTAK